MHLQKLIRGLKFWIYEVEELYYNLCSKNKGADRLQIITKMKKKTFSHEAAYMNSNKYYLNQCFSIISPSWVDFSRDDVSPRWCSFGVILVPMVFDVNVHMIVDVKGVWGIHFSLKKTIILCAS